MDKNAIKKYAVWARNELIARVSQRAQQYGITAEGYGDKNADSVNGVLLSAIEKKQRQALIAKIDAEGFEQVMEEVAYTWFNRFTALRFMEVNNYLPSHTRVFTNEANEFKPQILADAISLDLEGIDMDKVFELKNANKDEDLYKYLLIVQCNALNSILPEMFKKIEDFSGLLLPDYLLREGSIIDQMIKIIPEEDWMDQVEVIGWLYQYYINEPKDTLINAKKQYKSKDVPFVTQIFTSDWIVQYMVQNSIGRAYIESTNQDFNQYGWEYYLEAQSTSQEKKIFNPEEIKVVDPCMGSGHILAYVFDVLMQIYENQGYTQREAAELILEKNIYGTDISERAYQLAYFSIMMKARKYNRTILKKGITPNLYVLKNVQLQSDLIDFVNGRSSDIGVVLNNINKELKELGEFGSLIEYPNDDFEMILGKLEELSNEEFDDLISKSYQYQIKKEVIPVVKIAQLLSGKYDFVITNPPYIGNKFLPDSMRNFIEENYKDYKSDVFAAFMARIISMCKVDGYIGMLTPYVWMFISTYEELRKKVLEETSISSLVQLEYNAFEAACVPVCTFTLRKSGQKDAGEYVRLSEFRGPDIQGVKVKEAVEHPECGYRYSMQQSDYELIPGSPIAYWVDKKVISCFETGKRTDSFAFPKQGLATADNNRFLRLWFEVDINKVGLSMPSRDAALKSELKWFPYNKGGGFKKWYGNNEYLVNWENDGFEIQNFRDDKGKQKSRPQNMEWFFKQGLSWCKITSSNFSMRYIPQGFLFDVAGCTLFVEEKDIHYVLGYMNSKMNSYILALISPTLNFEVGHVGSLPIVFSEVFREEVEELVRQNILLCKKDWDSYENSWDFKRNPLVSGKGRLSDIYAKYEKEKWDDFYQLKRNEERLNEIFANIYGASEVIDPSIPNEEIIIGTPDYRKDVKALIAYAIGCRFGRYSLDHEGLMYAGGLLNRTNYQTYSIDADNIIPICDDEYFNDDIVAALVEFVGLAFGQEYLEDNLRFIASALGYEGSAREVIRQYFLNDFYNDHCDLYTSRGAGKRPIYWLFDSGKKNGFKCLIYMHRYQPDTIARIRTDYVHEQQSRYRTALADLEQRINSASTSERVKLNKQLKTIQDQAEELRKYEEKIHHLADQMISIDLDDGVKENYAKFQDVLAKIK